MTEADDAFAVVEEFLRRFYRNEPSNDVAGSTALQAQAQDYPGRWRFAQAFESLNSHAWPDGVLADLVREASGRLVVDDDEAKRFLAQVYDDNLFDLALDPSEFPE